MSVQWHRVLAADDLPDGRVTTVAAGHKSVALVHFDGRFSALDNHCPHPGGPLGEGSPTCCSCWAPRSPTTPASLPSAYARNCGALGIRVTNAAALDAAVAAAVAHEGPAMVEVITDPNLV